MYRHSFVPLAEQDGLLVIAIHDPGNLPALDELELLLKHPLRLVVSTKDAIMAVLTPGAESGHGLEGNDEGHRPSYLSEDEAGGGESDLRQKAQDPRPR